MTNDFDLTDEILGVDKKKLSSIIVGVAGAGKTYALGKMMKDAVGRFPKSWRAIYISPKHEMISGFEDDKKVVPQTNLGEVVKGIAKNRLTVWYPDMATIHDDLDTLIEKCFEYCASEDCDITMVLDDSSIVFDYGQPSDMWKKNIYAGRSKGLRFVALGHRTVQNTHLSSQTSHLMFFSLNHMEIKGIRERFGFDAEHLVGDLGDYRWIYAKVNDEPMLMTPFP